MRSPVSTWAASLAESSWLAALLALPVFYNVYSHETFEPDKIFLLRSLSALTLAALVVSCVDNGRSAWTVGERPLWQLPLVQPVCALTATYVLSTVVSIAPTLSLWGSYQRAQGLWTWFSYVAVFLAIVLLARQRQQWNRLVSVVVLASLPAAIYAILQRLDADPMMWNNTGALRRSTGMAGNAVFAGALFTMAAPLTLVRIISTWRSRVGLAHTAAYVLLLGLQAGALACTISRGPTVALCFALAAFVPLASLLRGKRWPVFAFLGVAAIAALSVVAMPSSSKIANSKSIERLAQPLAWEQSSGLVRVLIWGGVADLLRRDPVRAVSGYGPETLLLAFSPVFPVDLATIERPEVAPDRAHNEVFDTLVTTGVVGCVAELVLFAALFFHVLVWLGVLGTSAQRKGFVIVTLCSAVVGGLLPIAMGSGSFVGIGVALGLVVGVLAYVTAAAARPRERESRIDGSDAMLLAALFAAVLGHFVEVQVSLATSTTRLYFFAFAGLAVAIGSNSRASVPSDGRPDSPASSQPAVTGLLVALLLAVLTVDFDTPTVVPTDHLGPLAVLFASPWLFGFLLAAEDARRWEARTVGAYIAASTGPWLVFVALFAPRVELFRALTARATSGAVLATHLVGTVTLVHATVCAGVVAIAVALAWQPRDERAADVRWPGASAAVLLLGAATFIGVANLQLVRADCMAKLGEMYERQGAWSEAIAADERALLWAPRQQEYAVNLSRLLITRARVVAPRDPTQRDADAARAVQLMEDAERANPLSADHASNLARIYRKWARVGDPSSRPQRFERADAAYKRALALWPNNPLLWNELALLYLERGQQDQMLATFDHSVALNPDFLETYVRRAQVFGAMKRFDDANADYRKAREVNARWHPDPARLVDAYISTGQIEPALAEARAALADARPEEQANLRTLIHALGKAPPTAAR